MLKESARQESGDQGEESHESFGVIMIHQLIETIEFVLGTVSNTASYLRLWALSLAHSQLASVFFSFTVNQGLNTKSLGGSVAMLFFSFLVFGSVTAGVMMVMDVMECFLHTLRLHWVEFQGKFYTGGGHNFNPLILN